MISMIWAEDDLHGIGKNQTIPWHISEDMRFFKKTTSGHTVVMGRKTFDSIGRPLPNRENVVLTHNPTDLPVTVIGVNDIESIKQLADTNPEQKYFVIGGGHLYQAMLAEADELLITRVQGDFNCDVFAPKVGEEFELIDVTPGSEEATMPQYQFERWIRVSKA